MIPTPARLTLLALAVRALVAFRTAMPERDAAHYLWMADGFVHGAPERLFATVFHPVYPALVGALRWLWPTLDPVAAAQLVACVASALAVWPLWAVTRRAFGERAALAAGLAFALGTWFARHPADGLTEGVFHLCVAGVAALLAARPGAWRAMLAGVVTALAYGTRPEGAVLMPVGLAWLLARRERQAAIAFVLGGATALVFPLGWALLGDGFTLTPKATFVWKDGVGGADAGVAHYAIHVLHVPGALGEALGWVAALAALAGTVHAARTPRLRPTLVLLVPLAVQCAIVPLLRSHHRFLSGYGILWLPFAGHLWALVRPAVVTRGRLAVAAVCVVTFAADLVRLPAVRRDDRVVERRVGVWLGTWLRTRHAPDARLASTLQRVDYFAGVEPAPPREILPAELTAALDDPRVIACVFVGDAAGPSPAALAAAGMQPATLPDSVARDAAARRLHVFVR